MFETLRITSVQNPGFLPLLSQYLVEAGRQLPDTSALQSLEGAIRSDRVRFLVALNAGGRVVGVVSLTLSWSTQQMAPYAVLADLYVHPAERGRGAAVGLLLAAMDHAHEQGCCYLLTEIAHGMEGVFDRVGWRFEERLMRYDIPPGSAPPSLIQTGEITFD